MEAVTLRAVVAAPPLELAVPRLGEAVSEPATEDTTVVFGGESLTTRRVWRHDLRAGHKLEGPLIVQEYSATTWVPPQWVMEVDAWGCLHLLRS